MAIDSVVALSDALAQHRLLESTQLSQVGRWQARFTDPRALARELLQRGWLTPYQINQLFQGNGRDLVLGQYVLLERLGEGGMGQVFKARHQKLGRVVALKVIRKERLADPEAVGRFRREMQAVAQLTHPNVVAAIDADQDDDALFLIMDYVEGIDLGRLVRERGPLPVAEACEYIRQAALALQHAHEKGLVHRDVKPSNLLLAKAQGSQPLGLVKLLDLGLARLQQPSNDECNSLTQAGMVVGTPDYIAPEQARNARSADIRSDLYSLGCTFYVLLTGRTPFTGETTTEKLLHHCFDPPPPIEQLRPDVPPRVVKIVQKLMAKDPADRYPTPAKLVVALSRPGLYSTTTDRKPWMKQLLAILGRGRTLVHPDAPERLRKAAGQRRQLRLRLIGGAALALLLVVGLAALLIKGLAASRRSSGGEAGSTRLPLDQLDSRSIPAEEHLPWQPKELVAVLGKHRARSWGPLNLLAVSPDGQSVAGVAAHGFVYLWDKATLRERMVIHDGGSAVNVHTVAFAPDGRTLACGCFDGSIVLWDISRARAEKKATLRGHKNWITALAFAPGGAVLASGSADTTVRLWDVTRPNPSDLGTLGGHEGGILALAFAPDGRSFASAGRDPTIHLWDFNDNRATPRAVAKGSGEVATHLAYAAKGDRLFSTSYGRSIQVWDAASGKPLGSVDLAKGAKSGWSIGAFSPDGQLLARADGPGAPVQLWDLSGPEPRERGTVSSFGSSLALAFGPKGKTLVVSSQHRLQSWDVEAKPRLLTGPDDAPDVRAIALARDGRTLAAGDHNGRIGLWDLGGAEPTLKITLEGHSRGVLAVKFSPDGRLLASGGTDGSLRLWDLSGPQPREASKHAFSNWPVAALAFSGDGKTLAAGSHDRTARLYDVTSGKAVPKGAPLTMADQVSGVGLDADGQLLVCTLRDRSFRSWDLGAAPRQRHDLRLPRGAIGAMDFAPDARFLAVGTNQGVVRVWDLSASELRDRGEAALAQGVPIQAVAFAPRGDLLAASPSGRLFVVDPVALKVQRDWEMSGGSVDLAFSPDGRHLVSANSNGTVYVLRLAAPSFR